MARKMKSMDGNNAAAHVSYAYTDVSAIYPITPSSTMAEVTDLWSSNGQKNIFGERVRVVEMQSEAGAAGTVHGSLSAGALTTTFTASQGLLLMIPNIYKIAGEQLPAVFDVSARTVATHALSIFGDHSDVYACRQTGAAMLFSGSVQEVMDLTPVAHCAAIKGSMPFINVFDGFRTSHEIQKIAVWDYEDLNDLVDHDAIQHFRDNALNPEIPESRGSAQNPDIFFQAREACNEAYNRLPGIVEEYMNKVNEKIGTNYKLFSYYGAEDAEQVIIAMGSVTSTIEETIDYLTAQGEKVGLVSVHLYRPFSAKHLIDAIPKTVKKISVLDRTKEPGSQGEPLYIDVVAALRNSEFHDVTIYSGRYGLGSKNTDPSDILAVYRNEEKPVFTIGIVDDVTHLSLDRKEIIDTAPESTISCKFWGLGSDGTVGANKNSIKIIGDNTDMYAQAYFDYDSKKSGGITVSHLRFGKQPIKSTYFVSRANFVACHNPSYINKYDMVQEVKDGGSFLLNCSWSDEELEEKLPGQVKRYIAEHNINFYTIDGINIGKEIGLGTRINTILQAAFFKLAKVIPIEEAIRLMKDAATKSYGRKGEKVVKMNHDAIERGAEGVVKRNIPESWKNAEDTELHKKVTDGRENTLKFVNNIQRQINSHAGDKLPVSAFLDYQDGSTPNGTANYEKRGIAVDIPVWNPDNCIQCNFCSYVCPHAVIRPAVMNEEENAAAPEGMNALPMTGLPAFKFAITVSAYDCTGCGSCVNVCPGKKGVKALELKNFEENCGTHVYADYQRKLPIHEEVLEKFKPTTVKGSQFKTPLLEYSGACAGCGETPYAKLCTQLFGDRMYIANATGCSSIWGNSSPATPYTVGCDGRGPAWSNSLFEDNAEFGYGMFLAQETLRSGLKKKVEGLAEITTKDYVKEACTEYMDTYFDGEANDAASKKLVEALKKSHSEDGCTRALEILKDKIYLNKKSNWIFGGDGWAFDIGFGGLDHVLASGEDVNVLVFNTEVYSNTGGQSSKATPKGAVAQFAAAGKGIVQKDLAAIAMSYGYVYVAQVSMGADYNQCIKAFKEAESYPGPSIIIAYAPCITHGIRAGMGKSQTEEKLAVETGYWNIFRFNPALKAEGKNPFSLDCKAPSKNYMEFLEGEVRYTSLALKDPERAKQLAEESRVWAEQRYEHLTRLKALYEPMKKQEA